MILPPISLTETERSETQITPTLTPFDQRLLQLQQKKYLYITTQGT